MNKIAETPGVDHEMCVGQQGRVILELQKHRTTKKYLGATFTSDTMSRAIAGTLWPLQ